MASKPVRGNRTGFLLAAILIVSYRVRQVNALSLIGPISPKTGQRAFGLDGPLNGQTMPPPLLTALEGMGLADERRVSFPELSANLGILEVNPPPQPRL